MTSFRNDGRGAERSLGFRRDVALSMNTEDEARAKAQRLLADLGLDREFEIEEVRLEPETPDPDKPNRMKSWGTAHVQGRKIGDRPTFRGRNRWTVAYDRWDGAVLYYGLVDHLRFLEEGDTVGEAGARSAAAAVFAQIDAEDPSAFPAEWRRVSAVVFGWSSAGKQWIADYVARHGREPDFQAVVPAYKVSFSNSPWWPGWDEPSYVIVRASNGEILEIALS
ncbi:MAG: hypothetical protein IT207_07390 [Fimbriimonadaceae bacterium]|nr:hypothetical protein [Fimbriimonadaceae bacterium]